MLPIQRTASNGCIAESCSATSGANPRKCAIAGPLCILKNLVTDGKLNRDRLAYNLVEIGIFFLKSSTFLAYDSMFFFRA